MTRDQIHEAVVQALGKIAPEVKASQIDPAAPLRDQLDIDSMDFLNFVIALHRDTGVDVPERDYPRLATLNGCVDYLAGAAVRNSSSGKTPPA